VPDVSPVLSPAPQFTSEYWARIPRNTVVGEIERVTHREDGYTEIALKGGVAFKRKRSEIQHLLTRNLTVHVEAIGNGQVITGLFVPNLGWAFRMSNEDIAQYVKQLSLAQYQRHLEVKERMITHVTSVMEAALRDLNVIGPDGHLIDEGETDSASRFLATVAIGALERGPDEQPIYS
jgi:hypothetical protein